MLSLTLLIALACAEDTPVHVAPSTPLAPVALPVEAMSDSYGTSYPIDQIQLRAPLDLKVRSLELHRHDGSVTPVEITRRGQENDRLVLHFAPIEANEGVRMRAFLLTLEDGTKLEADVTYIEEFDGIE
jgi:hypothetical protein